VTKVKYKTCPHFLFGFTFFFFFFWESLFGFTWLLYHAFSWYYSLSRVL